MCSQTQKHAHTCSLYMVVCVCKVYLQPPNLSRAKPKSADFRLLDVGTKIQCCCHFCSWVGRGLPVFSCHNRVSGFPICVWIQNGPPHDKKFYNCQDFEFFLPKHVNLLHLIICWSDSIVSFRHKSPFNVTVSFQCSNKRKQEKVHAWCCMDRKLVALAGISTVGTRSTKRVVHCGSAWCLRFR